MNTNLTARMRGGAGEYSDGCAHPIDAHGLSPQPTVVDDASASGQTPDGSAATGQQDSYYAWLTGGRIVYDITENWDVGMLGMYQRDKNRQGQWAQGVEVGRLLGQNLWVSAGYNWA